MKLYIKSDFTKKIDFTTRELVWKMWFKERNGKKISFPMLVMMLCYRMIFTLVFGYTNGLSVDERWDKAPL